MDEKEELRGNEAKKRPYQPPAIDESAVFETLAVQCGKTATNYNCSTMGGGTGYTSS